MTKRIFIAVDISDESRAKTVAYQENLRRDFHDLRVGWERAEKLHLTLKFLGETDENQLSKLIEAVANASKEITKFTIKLNGTGVFPKPQNARILWTGLDDQGNNLLEIVKMLEAECAKIGFPKEAKKFHPHLTIARLREPNKSLRLVEKHLAAEFAPVEFEVSKIVIYESRLLPTGSKYQKIQEINLPKLSGVS